MYNKSHIPQSHNTKYTRIPKILIKYERKFYIERVTLQKKKRKMDKKKTDIQIQVINRIKKIRLSQDVSQREFANMLDITAGEIGNIESLKYKNKYTLRQLVAISNKMNIPIIDLLYDDDEKDNVEGINDILKRIVFYLD